MNGVSLMLCTLLSFAFTGAEFTLTVRVFHFSRPNTRCGPRRPRCPTYLTDFCLREQRYDTSTDLSDCRYGNGGRLDYDSSTATIASTREWPIHFQLYIRSENPTNHIYINAGMTPGTYRLMYNVLAAGDDRRVMISSLNMSIICSPNYYGPSCTSFCVPANDSIRGYYNCDASTGDKICHEGYHRPEELCRHQSNECEGNPCQNGGTCRDLLADYQCICPTGYSGKTCTTTLAIDQCARVRCPGNSHCVDLADTHMCQCNEGYAGPNCLRVPDPCKSNPCTRNNSNCVAIDNFRYTCECPAGFSGTDCEVNIDDCTTAFCSVGTHCTDGINSYDCIKPLLPASNSSVRTYVAAAGAVGGIIILVLIASILLVAFAIRRKKGSQSDKREFS